MQNFKKITMAFVLTVMIWSVKAQDKTTQDWKNDRKVAILFGLSQPLLVSGFNIEGNIIFKRFIFDYSHGVSLDFGKDMVTDELKNQGVVVHIPWTTGFGLGYRFTEWLNLRVEPKWHKFEYYYAGDAQNDATQITKNTTFSLGLGLYGFFQPFKKKDNFLKGIIVAPSIRFWPTVSSSFAQDKFTYENTTTEETETIKTLDPGIGFTPLVINISVGYTFDFRKK